MEGKEEVMRLVLLWFILAIVVKSRRLVTQWSLQQLQRLMIASLP